MLCSTNLYTGRLWIKVSGVTKKLKETEWFPCFTYRSIFLPLAFLSSILPPEIISLIWYFTTTWSWLGLLITYIASHWLLLNSWVLSFLYCWRKQNRVPFSCLLVQLDYECNSIYKPSCKEISHRLFDETKFVSIPALWKSIFLH